MKRLIKLSILASMALSATVLMAEEVAVEVAAEDRERSKSVKEVIGKFAPTEVKDITVVDKFKNMFTDGKVTGRVKSVYAGYDQKENAVVDTYATALGGMLKYELAEYNGFNGGVAFTTSNDLRFATGSRDEFDSIGNPIQRKQNDELSSSDGSYTQVTEAYINYEYENLNIRLGRQVLETPLADSDDIRMIPNTFEAYVATYDLNGVEIMAGNMQRWQGIDAGLDEGWVKTGENGTWFGGVSYGEDFEFNAWYYNVTKLTNAAYVDIGYNYQINKDIKLYGTLQYLNEREIDGSGVKADIYGALVEVLAYGIGFNIAIDKSKKHTGMRSYSGTGGGTMFTSMDTMIIDEIADDREATAIVGGVVYEYDSFAFLYAYGDFKGKANSAGEKAHIVEQNMGFEYTFNDEFQVAALYAMEEDKESVVKNENDWNRLQVMVAYNF